MILVDALYIHIGGPKILLDYLINELEKTEKNITYLLDARYDTSEISVKCSNKVIIHTANYYWRRKFYQQHKDDYLTVLCMANLPPNIRLACPVYTYFHNPPFLWYIRDFSTKRKLLFSVKRYILNKNKKNTDYWLVQSKLIAERFIEKYEIDSTKVFQLPFYASFKEIVPPPKRIKDKYVYVSLGIPYKNHIRLIKAFCLFYDRHRYGELVITIPSQYTKINTLIKKTQKAGYPIKNVGYVNRAEVQQLFYSAEYHVFPSLTESLGLGIIESIECGCKVMGANLPYMHAACEPSIVFDPLDVNSIVTAFEQSIQEDIQPSVNNITNHISKIIALLN